MVETASAVQDKITIQMSGIFCMLESGHNLITQEPIFMSNVEVYDDTISKP